MTQRIYAFDFGKETTEGTVAYEHVFKPGSINFTINTTHDYEVTKQVREHLDPNGCHQCYVLRSKYVKMANLKRDEFAGARDVELVKCPVHQREYIQGIKKQLTEAVEKIGK